MSIPELLILAVSLSADAFAVSVCKGLAMGKIKFSRALADAIRGAEEKASGGLDVKEMLLLAVATSIDAFAAGVSMALVEVNIVLSAAVIGVMTLVLSTGGVYVGGIFGDKFEKPARIAGGAALVALAVKILIEGIITLNK